VGKLHHEHLFSGQVLMCQFDHEDDTVYLLPFSGEVILFPLIQLDLTARSQATPGNKLEKQLEHLGVDLSAR
jgi:hypothetical protein